MARNKSAPTNSLALTYDRLEGDELLAVVPEAEDTPRATKSLPRPKEICIYLLVEGDPPHRRVKIGQSDRSAKDRRDELQGGNWRRITVRHQTDRFVPYPGWRVEKLLHDWAWESSKGELLEGEWFRCSPESAIRAINGLFALLQDPPPPHKDAAPTLKQTRAALRAHLTRAKNVGDFQGVARFEAKIAALEAANGRRAKTRRKSGGAG